MLQLEHITLSTKSLHLLQNQKVADERYKYFPIILIWIMKLQLKGYSKFLQQIRYCHMMNLEQYL